MPGSELRGEIIKAAEVSPALEDWLYALYQEHYDGSDRARFAADLAEKEWIILLHEVRSSAIVGFSTQAVMDIDVCMDGEEPRPVRALFSGDTIIHRDYWGSQELVRTWCRFAGQVKAQCPDRPLYWFLISKGYRTYMYLPLFFREFFPRYDRLTPAFESSLIRALGAERFGKDFDPSTGLIRHPDIQDRLKAPLDSTPRRLQNPHVAFFVRRNPHYAEGDELLCIAEISPENMLSTARRELERGMWGDDQTQDLEGSMKSMGQ